MMIKSASQTEENKVFDCYLESVSHKLSLYRVEIQQDKLVIRSSSGKVKLQFDMNTISPFSGY